MDTLTKTKHGKTSSDLNYPGGKRSCPRYPFSSEIEVIDVDSATRLRARLSDIGRNGCYADTVNPFPKDSSVTVTITRDNLSFKSHARVIFSILGMGMGLLFTTAEPDQLQVLGRWLSELSGEKAAQQTAQQAPKRCETHLAHTPEAANITDPELRKIIVELMALLNDKSILTDSEAIGFLRRLSK